MKVIEVREAIKEARLDELDRALDQGLCQHCKPVLVMRKQQLRGDEDEQK